MARIVGRAVSVARIQAESELLHLVVVSVLVVTVDAKVKVLAHGAMVSCLDALLASVAGVDELILSLGVQFVKQGHRRELDPPETGEFQMLLPGHCEEGVPPVHEIAGHERIRVLDGTEAGGALCRVKADREEHLFVLLHGHKHLGSQVASRALSILLLVVFALLVGFLLLLVLLLSSFLSIC